MPTEKKINARYQQKHDVEAHWKQAVNFIPKAGEIIVYDADETHDSARIKIGDGHTPINSLLFVEQSCAPTANLLGLLHPNNLKVEYSTQGTGWLCQIVDDNNVQLARKYFTQGVPTEWTHYSIPFTTKTGTYATINIRKASEDASYIPGDFAFDNFEITSGNGEKNNNLVVNGDFESGVSGWTITTSNNDYWVIANHPNGGSCFKTHITNKYATMLSQSVPAKPNTTYIFSFSGCGLVEGAKARIELFNNGNTSSRLSNTYSWDLTQNGFKEYGCYFTTPADTQSITIALRGYLDSMYDNLNLRLRADIKNGDFSNGMIDWDTQSTYSSAYVPGEIVTEGGNSYMRSQCEQIGEGNTSSVLMKQTHIYTDPNVTYTLEFDLKRLSESATWQDYMTLMEQDKFALMNENTIGAGEYPKFGGPWANTLHYDYILRCIIEKPEDVHFDLSHVGLLTNIVSALGSEVIVEGHSENGWFHVARQEFDENIGWAETVPDKSKIVPCNDLQDNEFDAIRITLTFKNDSTMVDENFQPTKNFLKGIRLYGHSDISLPECELPMRQDYFGNVHCSNEVRAVKFVGDIDDGCLDWGCN